MILSAQHPANNWQTNPAAENLERSPSQPHANLFTRISGDPIGFEWVPGTLLSAKFAADLLGLPEKVRGEYRQKLLHQRDGGVYSCRKLCLEWFCTVINLNLQLHSDRSDLILSRSFAVELFVVLKSCLIELTDRQTASNLADSLALPCRCSSIIVSLASTSFSWMKYSFLVEVYEL